MERLPVTPIADAAKAEEARQRMETPSPLSRQFFLTACCILAVGGLLLSVFRLAGQGVGLLGVNNAVPWGWDIVQFVFWIGIGHAGTLISSVLLITNQGWRTPVARTAELMTLCAVVCAVVFPITHVGRMAMLWLMSPAPVSSGVWPDTGSPLSWDVLAVGSYFLLSLTYWLIGMAPDCAVMSHVCRKPFLKRLFSSLSFGWKGDRAQWQLYGKSSLNLAFVLTPLVVTVHSVVSFDFASTQRIGWHETFFPPFFVAGAILSGMAMVQLLTGCSKQREIFRTQQVISRYVLGFSCLMAFFYALEILFAYMGSDSICILVKQRLQGEIGWFWLMIVGNVLLPQLYWVKRWRSNRLVMMTVSVGVLCGMWCERVLIVVGASLQSLIPGRTVTYEPTFVDLSMFAGSIGLFFALYLWISRLMPPEFTRKTVSLRSCSPWYDRIPVIGAALGIFCMIAWLLNAETSVTSAVVQGRLSGWDRLFSFIPAIFVCGVLGAGIAVAVVFFLHMRRHGCYDSKGDK